MVTTDDKDREAIVKETWRQINVIASDTEDAQLIRSMIRELGIEPNIHIGRAPGEFTPLMTGEWVLGQWADLIDADLPFLNQARNISIDQYETLYGTEGPED